MTWSVELDRNARRDLKSVRDRRLRQHLVEALLALRHTPRPPGVKKLKGHASIWRIRIGDWRICYRIEDDRLVVLVITIAPRGEVYDVLARRLKR